MCISIVEIFPPLPISVNKFTHPHINHIFWIQVNLLLASHLNPPTNHIIIIIITTIIIIVVVVVLIAISLYIMMSLDFIIRIYCAVVTPPPPPPLTHSLTIDIIIIIIIIVLVSVDKRISTDINREGREGEKKGGRTNITDKDERQKDGERQANGKKGIRKREGGGKKRERERETQTVSRSPNISPETKRPTLDETSGTMSVL